MYLVRVKNPTDLHPLKASLEAISELAHLDLGELNALALTELVDQAPDWMRTSPVIYDEAMGLCVAAFSMQGIAWLQQNADELIAYGVIPEQVMAFTKNADSGEIYFVDTF